MPLLHLLYPLFKVNFMIHKLLKYSILFGLTFVLLSCDKLIFDQVDGSHSGRPDSDPTVYMSITRAAHTLGEESINKDGTDYEDRVHDMAMFVFDNSTGSLVREPYFESNIPITDKSKTFVVQLTPGQRDFYFVANMPKAQLETITTRLALETYMNLTVNLDENLYLNATITNGFPMARVYTNQTITKSGTIYTPAPFKPDGQDRVTLLRAVAQLQVDIDGSEIESIKNVYYKNAFRQFSLLSLANPIATPTYYVEAINNNAMRKVGNSYVYNMPEALMTTPTTPTPPTWTGVANHKPINYFVIETITGTTYEIPIITYEGAIPSGNYLSFALGNEVQKPDYNIYRNRRYVYTIKSLENIHINYTVNPWTLVQSSFYMGYGYNVGVDQEGNVTVSNSVLACTPHEVKLKTKSGFTFDGGGAERTFNNTAINAVATYKIIPIPTSGQAYLDVEYNGVVVKTFIK